MRTPPILRGCSAFGGGPVEYPWLDTSTRRRMPTIYIDADACPVKEETYRVARRYSVKVVVVANAPLRVPVDTLVELVVRPGFGAADDWIAEQAAPGDIAVTADVPLAARCVA